MKPRVAPSIDEAALEARITARVLAHLVAALGGDVEVWPKTSARADAPKGVSPRRWSNVIAPDIGRKSHPGARFYIVERADWLAYLARTSPTAPAICAAPVANDATREPWTPAKALAAAGLRATR